jgi:hypothetical protein
MICAYCSAPLATGLDECRRPVCPHCAALDQPSHESLRIAESLIDVSVFKGLSVN